MKRILERARKLIEEQDYSVRDALYAASPNGEAEAAAVKLVFADDNLSSGVGLKDSALIVFDRLIRDETVRELSRASADNFEAGHTTESLTCAKW
jgi:hypothetical protein